MSIHSSGRNGSFSPPIIAQDVPRGLPEQGNSPGTVTAPAASSHPPCTRAPGLVPWYSCPWVSLSSNPLWDPHPEDGQQIPAGCLALVRTGLRQVPVVVKSWWKAQPWGHGTSLLQNDSSAVTVEADGLPAAPRFLSRRNFLHTAHTPAETCPCLALHASPRTLLLLLLLHQGGRATSSHFWQVLSSSSTCCTDEVSPTYVASDPASRAAAASLAQPVQTPAPAPLPVQLRTPNPAARHSSGAAVCTSGLAGRQHSVIQLERS